ncbi:hypothetical protein [Acidobacterium sp. S8]|uniref:hypothetical protein n=1 Tax=Acidobacterium sp. S8 TaxID=1641854 RepID=UPI00131AB8C7|nr:hypothetical protein [Acidobacterium sp. S8]
MAFQPDKYFSQYDGIIAGFQLWDRIGENVAAAVQALGSNDEQVADRYRSCGTSAENVMD